MPAKLSTSYGIVNLSVEPNKESNWFSRRNSGIYFTDESPEFYLVVQNPSDTKITNETQDKRAIRYFIGIGTGDPEYSKQGAVKFDLEPHSTKRIPIGDFPLAFQGNGIVAVWDGHTETRRSTNETTLLLNTSARQDNLFDVLLDLARL